MVAKSEIVLAVRILGPDGPVTDFIAVDKFPVEGLIVTLEYTAKVTAVELSLSAVLPQEEAIVTAGEPIHVTATLSPEILATKKWGE